MTILWILFWLVIWFLISLTTFALLVYSVALSEDTTFVKILFDDEDLCEQNCVFMSILFPIGIILAMIGILIHFITNIIFTFSFRPLLKKIFIKKYIRERVIDEV